MTIVLTPYWSNGQQKIKVEPQAPAPPPAGLLPPAYIHAVHAERSLLQLRSKATPIEKNIFLSQLKDADLNTFYKLCLANMSEITPLIYTPTVGDACLQFSQNFRRPEGLFISIKDKGKIGSILRNWPRLNEARISVVTDGSRILGLGDLGVNGMPISIGKLSLYVAGAGVRPTSTLPICLDLGTNNQKFLDDPLYLGLRQKRVSDEEMDEFMDEFMAEITTAFPKLLVQFEDFSTDHAFAYLARFRDRYPVFNDDIQGTGAVVLSGLINAAAIANIPARNHRILFFGAGSAGVGVAMQLISYFTLNGLSVEEARDRVWLVDSKGLVYDGRAAEVAEHKKCVEMLTMEPDFSRRDYTGAPLTDLLEIIEYVKPTALMGLSTIKSAFTEPVIRAMAKHNVRPIIFPLSNPVRLSECEFQETLEWSEGRAIFASGSPFPETTFEGRRRIPGQGNNMYIFPGLGLGSIIARVTSVTDSMVEASALGLANSLTEEERGLELVYPAIHRIREISGHVAVRVIRAAQKAGVDQSSELRSLSDEELTELVHKKMWYPC
ncbi:hypothetical protein BJ138DRAFT_1104052 [Hygrophoropsis aurantiaca]|uniref:Uncharacterized protein n=1 Tax=Hygrophoropsis aurantiaca TaxID=72124 RepID=A0ACB8A404_9AGAM|nr:hypothetical protein BJ138DRAFT_1104052 [Hygrophoropsis aurantiaca]